MVNRGNGNGNNRRNGHGNRTTTAQRKASFLHFFSRGHDKTDAAAATGVQKKTIDTWQRDDLEFRRLYEELKGQRPDIRKAAWIAAYIEKRSVGEACKAIGIGRSTFYNWLEADNSFSNIYELELKPNKEDELESRMLRIAHGDESASQSQVTSAIFMLKALNPRKYADKWQLSGVPEEPIPIRVVEVRKSYGDGKSTDSRPSTTAAADALIRTTEISRVPGDQERQADT